MKKTKRQNDVVDSTKNMQSVAQDSIAENSSQLDAESSTMQAEVPTDAQENETGTEKSETEKPLEGNVAAPQKKRIKFFSAGNLAVMGILTAISFVLYAFVKFPLSFMFPFWLEIQFSDLPALLGGFSLGPVAGCIIIVIKCCLKMPMSSTACVGEIADIIVGIAYVLPASLIYRAHKNRKGAIVGMAVGSVCAVCMSVLANWLVLIPFYAKTMFGNGSYEAGMNTIVGMISTLYSGITVDNFYAYYLPLGIVPFNIIRCLLCAVITYFTYKPLSKALHWEIVKKNKGGPEAASGEAVQETLQNAPDGVGGGESAASENDELPQDTTDKQ